VRGPGRFKALRRAGDGKGYPTQGGEAMRAICRGWLVPWFLVLSALGGGCNVLSLPYFLQGEDPQVEAKMKKVASDDKKKEVKIAILTWSRLDPRPELIRADRELTELLSQELRDAFKTNKENVKVILPRKVEEYKNQHPSWKETPYEDIGKDLGVDYVFYLEISDLELYKKGSFRDLYQGHVIITVSLKDVNDPDASPPSAEFDCTYPSEAKGGAVAVDIGSGPGVFREQFLRYVAKKLSWYITSHSVEEDYKVE
jgi:hypothetical protein